MPGSFPGVETRVGERAEDLRTLRGGRERGLTAQEGHAHRENLHNAPALLLPGGSLHSRGSDGAPGAERAAPSLLPADTGYDDAEEVSLAHPHEDTKVVRLDPGAKRSLSPGPGEPAPAVRLGAPGMEERSVQLGEP